MSSQTEENKTETDDDCLYVSSISHKEIKITELEVNNVNQQGVSSQQLPAQSIEKDSKYIVEEPLDYGYDYIFEPDHNKPLPTGEKFKFATSVGEINGVMEYEYKSFRLKCEKESFDEEQTDSLIGWDLMNEPHLDSNVRSISMIKWPNVGFGFELDMEKIGTESFVYVKNIVADSPSEFSLQLGDILIEMDEYDVESDLFQDIKQLNEYLNTKENIHLFVVHESKYFRLKSENGDLLKNHIKNCEDFVIFSKNIE